MLKIKNAIMICLLALNPIIFSCKNSSLINEQYFKGSLENIIIERLQFLAGQSRINSKIEYAKCPEKLKMNEGSSTECVVKFLNEYPEKIVIKIIDKFGTSKWFSNGQQIGTDFPLFMPSKIVAYEMSVVYQRDFNLSISNASIKCPDNIPIKINRKFQCVVTSEKGKKIRLDVNQTNNLGGFHWNPNQEIEKIK